MSYHYTHRLLHLSAVMIEVTIWSRWWLTYRHTTVKVQRMRDFGMLSPIHGISITLLPSKIQGSLQKRDRRTLPKPDQIPTWRRGGWEILPLAKELLTSDNFCEMENQFSLRVWPLVDGPCSCRRPHTPL